ncbi:class I SAM-dependent methyltransferase [Mariniplasma anaerobium]|uniref:Methyltransferase n=1 Tax=Mariniplasma anaerobium TaxID=2735436 RepID=A0A7U9TJ50_9MOLU|nr:class I SAM-dependent methyltransferase [Mariniplasma anaerobium]BCR35156.1 methyltransferase [Mariniplasma anaerobium]
MKKDFVKINEKTVDEWCKQGWEWGKPIDHQTYINATKGKWDVVLTPNIVVPKDWFLPFKGLRVLGLASGGGQQMPIFAALGAQVTVFDLSDEQLKSERIVQQREGYDITIIKGDMTKKLPFKDESFDLIFHPVSNVYVKDVYHVFKECSRVLRKGGLLLSGLDTGTNFIVDESETQIVHKLPFDPLVHQDQYDFMIKNDYGMQFSHTVEEQIKGQLQAGFELLDIFEDTNNEGRLFELNIGCYIGTKSRKK